jgi:hypothetical protein
MAATLNPAYVSRNRLRQWPDDATEGLIRRRRFYQEEFRVTAIQRQRRLWTRISNHIFNQYNFNVTEDQCRNKWNALLAGYNNLKDLTSGIRTDCTPSLYDRKFHNELSDEFWKITGNYLII